MNYIYNSCRLSVPAKAHRPVARFGLIHSQANCYRLQATGYRLRSIWMLT